MVRLRKRIFGSGLVVIVLALAASVAVGGPTTMRFLRIATLPQIAGMGEAVVAASDATWAEANPSHLINIDGSLVTFSHTAWFEDIALETLTFGTSNGKHGFGISVVGLHTDALEGYDALGVPQGTFRFFDLAVSASYARRIGRSLRLGVTGRTLYEKIDWDSASGFAADLGLGYTVPARLLGGEFAAGAALKNLGTKVGYHDEEFELPMSWQGGLTYRPLWMPEQMKLLVAVDYEKTKGYDGGVLAGLELDLVDMIAVRVGHRSAYENGDLAFGVGLRLARASIDYAYADMGGLLGNTHRISLGFTAGSVFPSPDTSQ
jgi:hypothetical protein